MSSDTAATGMVSFLGVPADRRLLGADRSSLPEAEQREEPVVLTPTHDRLVLAGSLLTGTTLIGGAAMVLYGAWQALLESGGALDVVLALVGVLLVATHWGWVHVAEYVGVGIDDRQQRHADEGARQWLESLAPYPRFSVTTRVLGDASIRLERSLHQPVLTGENTFTFERSVDAERSFDAHAPAAEVAAAVESMRREARLETDRLAGLWEAAHTAYEAALLNAGDEQQRLLAQRAAAAALSEHLNALLLEPPLVE
jgi:hypothetical protein